MAIQKIKISALPKAESVYGLSTIGVHTYKDTDEVGNVVDKHESVQVSLDFIKEAADEAQEAANTANTATTNANNAATDAMLAADSANTAAQNANDAATVANAAAQNATDKGELAEAAADVANKAAETIDERMQEKLDALVANAPEALDTLVELAAALGNDPNFATTVAAELAKKATKEDISDVTAKIEEVSTGPAGGDLTGNYPNPTIGTGKIVTDKIADGAVTAAKMAADVKLPTPEALTFTGGATGSFDGSEAKVIPVPYAWAQSSEKPTYTPSEVGALPVNNPSAKGSLSVESGGIKCSSFGSQQWMWYEYVTGADTVFIGIPGYNGKTWRLRLDANGRMDWGNADSRAAGDFYTGKSHASSGFFQDSDARLKDIDKELDCSIESIAQLVPIYYRWKDFDKRDDRRHIGFVAQDVKEIFPELVVENEDGTLSLNYAELSAVAIRGIQLLKRRADELEERISNLESKITR